MIDAPQTTAVITARKVPDNLPRHLAAAEKPPLLNKVAVGDAWVANIDVSSDTSIAGVLIGVWVASVSIPNRIRVDVEGVVDEGVEDVVDEIVEVAEAPGDP